MPSDGWGPVWRRLLASEVWHLEPLCRGAAWVWLLLRAAHRSVIVERRGRRIVLGPGELVASTDQLAKAWRWERTKVRRFLAWLEHPERHMIERRRAWKAKDAPSIIRLVAWDSYRPTTAPERSQTAPSFPHDTRPRDSATAPGDGPSERPGISSVSDIHPPQATAPLYKKIDNKKGKGRGLRQTARARETIRARDRGAIPKGATTLTAWIASQPVRPSPEAIASQQAHAVALETQHSGEEITAAMMGMCALRPFGWDLGELRQSFGHALRAGRRRP